jgi:hypothetical protein
MINPHSDYQPLPREPEEVATTAPRRANLPVILSRSEESPPGIPDASWQGQSREILHCGSG